MHGFPTTKYAVTNTVIDVKLSPGYLIGGSITSVSATDGYLVFYNKPAAEVVLGTTVPYYFVSCFGLSTSPLVRAGEAAIFDKAISVAFVDDVPTGVAARIGNVTFIIQ